MKLSILILAILLLAACERATEPIIESPKILDGWWKFEFVTYEYMGQRDIVTGQFELRTGSGNLIGVLVHNGIPYAIIAVELENRIIISALAQTERIVFDVIPTPDRNTLNGHVELLHYYDTHWSTEGYYPVTIQRTNN